MVYMAAVNRFSLTTGTIFHGVASAVTQVEIILLFHKYNNTLNHSYIIRFLENKQGKKIPLNISFKQLKPQMLHNPLLILSLSSKYCDCF